MKFITIEHDSWYKCRKTVKILKCSVNLLFGKPLHLEFLWQYSYLRSLEKLGHFQKWFSYKNYPVPLISKERGKTTHIILFRYLHIMITNQVLFEDYARRAKMDAIEQQYVADNFFKLSQFDRFPNSLIK
jgi:hypothetical protein